MIISISNQNLTAQINLKGAELISLQKTSTQEEYIWEGNPEFWGKHSPILFPIVGTLKNNSFIHNDKIYEMSRHGFARDLEFQIQNQTKESLSLALKSNSFTKENYPFEFELVINYKITNSSLEVSYNITNTDIQKLPFSIGGHPAFALKGKFEDFSLEFDTNETLKCYSLISDLISNEFKEIPLRDRKLPLTYSLFQNDALIIKKMKSKSIVILRKNNPFLKFDFKDFPNFGIWTKVGAPFICLEPWAGFSDSVEHLGKLIEKEGIQILEPKSEKKFTYTISILN